MRTILAILSLAACGNDHKVTDNRSKEQLLLDLDELDAQYRQERIALDRSSAELERTKVGIDEVRKMLNGDQPNDIHPSVVEMPDHGIDNPESSWIPATGQWLVIERQFGNTHPQAGELFPNFPNRECWQVNKVTIQYDREEPIVLSPMTLKCSPTTAIFAIPVHPGLLTVDVKQHFLARATVVIEILPIIRIDTVVLEARQDHPLMDASTTDETE